MNNVPKLRFSCYRENWKNYSIQELISTKAITGHLDGNHGALYPRSEEFTDAGVPYVSANDFASGTLYLPKCKCLPLERASKFKKGVARDGDVLFAHNATVGPVTILSTDLDFVILSTTATYFRCSLDKLSNHFLKAYFSTEKFIRQYSRVMSQSTRNQVPISAQRQFEVSLPAIEEQQKIAAFLAAVDIKIEQFTQKEALLKQYKKGVMQKIFSQEIRFKADDGSEFSEWEKMPLNEVLLERKLLAKKSEGLEHISLTTEGVVAKSDRYERDFLVSDDNQKKYKVTKLNDICYNPANIKFGVICRNTYGEGIFSPIYVTFEVQKADPKFVEYFVTRWDFINKARKYEEGTVYERQAVKPEDLLKVESFLPNLDEQEKIAQAISKLDKKIEAVNEQINQARIFKKGLLQQMFV